MQGILQILDSLANVAAATRCSDETNRANSLQH
jgi:hypothetical protein